jgi:hypothetical protein
MPNNIVKSFADKSGQSVADVEKQWNKAEEIVKDKYKLSADDGDKFYSLVTGVLKKMLKIEDVAISTGSAGLATGTPSGGAGNGVYAAKVGATKKRRKKKLLVFKEYVENHG